MYAWRIGAFSVVDIRMHPIQRQAAIMRESGIADPVIIDAGARGGDPLRAYLRAMPTAHVWAFEPEPKAYEDLLDMFDGDPRVHLHNLALSCFHGDGYLYLHGGGTDSMYPRVADPVYYPPRRNSDQKITIAAMQLDLFVRKHPEAMPHIIKADVQGAELELLYGAEQVLDRVRAIYAEVSFVPIYQGAPLYHEVASFLAGKGFGLFRFYFMTHAQDGQARQADALFVRRAYNGG